MSYKERDIPVGEWVSADEWQPLVYQMEEGPWVLCRLPDGRKMRGQYLDTQEMSTGKVWQRYAGPHHHPPEESHFIQVVEWRPFVEGETVRAIEVKLLKGEQDEKR